jgi:hypothetical protein
MKMKTKKKEFLEKKFCASHQPKSGDEISLTEDDFRKLN